MDNIGEQSIERKFSIEFVDNVEVIKQKTSDAKKTCRALIELFTGLNEIELAYSNSLTKLEREGTASVFGCTFSILNFKNREER
jgi:hypothetical protein